MRPPTEYPGHRLQRRLSDLVRDQMQLLETFHQFQQIDAYRRVPRSIP